MNGYMRTALLMAVMTALFLMVGGMIGGQGGMMFALVFALGMNLFAYWNSDTLALRSYRAQPIDAGAYPMLDQIIERLSQNAGFATRPKAYIILSDQPNAFATGRNPEHAAVAMTEGLLRMLRPEEIEAVLAHEFAHIKNRDTLIMTITATISGALSAIANFAMFMPSHRDEEGNQASPFTGILLAIVAPMAAGLVQMAISRSREYEADRVGAELCGNPLALASALEKISGGVDRIVNRQAESHPATAHMFIMNPLSGRGITNLFSTHPDPRERIALLREMAKDFKEISKIIYDVSEENTAQSEQEKGPWG